MSSYLFGFHWRSAAFKRLTFPYTLVLLSPNLHGKWWLSITTTTQNGASLEASLRQRHAHIYVISSSTGLIHAGIGQLLERTESEG